MSSKKKPPITSSTSTQTLKIGSRVRCTDDHVAGRIVWANGVSVKIQWDDGEQVTWRRDSLADRPIEILAQHGNEDQTPAPAAADDATRTDPSESPHAEATREPAKPASESPS